METISIKVILMFIGSAGFQILAVYLIPLTNGMTKLLPSILTAVSFIIGISFLAKLSSAGVNLSILVPLMSTIIPLASIAIGVFIYGDKTSFVKISLLVIACVMIGVASRIKA